MNQDESRVSMDQLFRFPPHRLKHRPPQPCRKSLAQWGEMSAEVLETGRERGSSGPGDWWSHVDS